MSTVISQDSVRQLKSCSQRERVTPRLAGRTLPRSPILRLLAWYRQAVTKPVSDEEKAEWQEISF